MRNLSLLCVLLTLLWTSIAVRAQGTATSPSADISSELSSEEGSESPSATFYQNLEVQRFPQFMVQGLKTAQQIHYQVSSSFRVYAPDEDKYRKVEQKIESTKLVKADALSQAVFAQSLAAMKGRMLTYKVTESGEVLSVEGHEGNKQAIDIVKPKSKGMLISSVMDEDGWKELAQLTLFQPPKTTSKKPFLRKTTHDWGSLGSWYGETQFKGATKSRKPKKYSYQHKLQYMPPMKKEGDASISMMGLTVEDAKFKVQKGAGEILYDHKQGHVTAVRELFHARGTVATKMLGNAATIAIDERQIFTIRVSGYQESKPDVLVPSPECDTPESK